MAKKVISLILVVVVIVAVFFGFNVSKDENQVITLKLWHYYNSNTRDIFDELVQTFNETIGQEEGIIIDAYGFGGVDDLADAVFGAANKDVGAEEMPDIFAAYSDNVVRLDELNLIASLDDYFTKDELNSYRREFIEEGYLGKNEGLKIIPIAKSTEMIFINDTDFQKFASATGSSYDEFKTWESLAKMAKKYYQWIDDQTEQLNDGKALFGIDAMANFMIVGNKQLGQEIYLLEDDQIKINLSKENARKIWDAFYVPFIQGHYVANGRFRSDDMKAGDLLAYVGSTSSASYFPTKIELDKDNARDIHCVTMPYPVFEDGSKVSIQQGAGMAVTKSNPSKEEAASIFLKWFTNAKQNNQFAADTGYMPVKNEGLNENLAKVNQDNIQSVEATIETMMDQVSEYELYATIPFDGSFEARKIVEQSLINQAKKDKEIITSEVIKGQDEKIIIESMVSDENFNQWYSLLIKELHTTLEIGG